MDRIVFKFTDGGDSLRRVAFSSSDLSYSKFIQVVSALFEGWDSCSVVTYTDDDGDIISIKSDMDLRECVRLSCVAPAALPVVRARVHLSGLLHPPGASASLVEGLSSSVLAAVPASTPLHVGPRQAIHDHKSHSPAQPNLLSQSMTASSVLEHSNQTLSSVSELSRSTAQSVHAAAEMTRQLDDQVQSTLSKAAESREATKIAIECELRKLRDGPSMHAQTLADTASHAASTAQQSIAAAEAVKASLTTL